MATGKKDKLTSTIRLWTLLGAFILVFVCAFSASPVLSSDKSDFTAVVLEDFPPLYLTNELGQPDGFGLELLDIITEDTSLTYDVLVVKTWAEALNALHSGKGDIIPGIGIGAADSANFLFSEVMETAPAVCFVRSSSHDIRSERDLVGRKVALLLNSTIHKEVKRWPGVEYITYRTMEEALFALLSQRVDGFIIFKSMLEVKAEAVGVRDKLKTIGGPLMELRRGFLFRLERGDLMATLNASLTRFRGSDRYVELYLKWWGAPKPFWTQTKVMLAVAAMFLLTTGMMGVWRLRSLALVNKELKQTIAEREQMQSQLEASEARLNRAQEITTVGSFERDLVNDVGYWSQGMNLLLGYRSRNTDPSLEDFMGQVHPDDRSKFKLDPNEFTPEDAEHLVEFRFRPLGEEEYRYGICRYAIEFDKHGIPVKRIGALQDITERKQIEAELESARNRAEESSQTKSEFLANMSHELRTPLNGAMGLLQLLAMDDLSKEHRECVETAISSCKHLTDLMGDILDLAKVEAGKLSLETTEFQPKSIVDSVRGTFAMAASDKGVELPVTMGTDIPVCLEGDPARLRQVLFNLLGNALKFTDKGKVEVKVSSLTSSSPEECRLLFVVSDTGIGIPDRMLDRVFDAFTQVEGADTRKYQGTGLGLHIVKRLADLMGGNVSLESEEGVGTTVYFTVPFKIATQQPFECHPEGEEQSCLLLESKRILLAEDERVNQMAVRRFLERMGHSVESVFNGEEAFMEVSRNDYDLILMDIQMPAMNGIEATKLIRSSEHLGDKRNIPIVALTAHAMAGDREKFLESGMDDYISKPVDLEELQKVLSRQLGNKEDA